MYHKLNSAYTNSRDTIENFRGGGGFSGSGGRTSFGGAGFQGSGGGFAGGMSRPSGPVSPVSVGGGVMTKPSGPVSPISIGGGGSGLGPTPILPGGGGPRPPGPPGPPRPPGPPGPPRPPGPPGPPRPPGPGHRPHPRPPPNWGNRPWNYRPIWGNNYNYLGWGDYAYWYPGYFNIYEQPLWYVFYDTIDNYNSISKQDLKAFILSLPSLCKSTQCSTDIINYLNMFNIDYIISDRNLLSNLLVNVYNRLSRDM
jgi:hypothetical protein